MRTSTCLIVLSILCPIPAWGAAAEQADPSVSAPIDPGAFQKELEVTRSQHERLLELVRLQQQRIEDLEARLEHLAANQAQAEVARGQVAAREATADALATVRPAVMRSSPPVSVASPASPPAPGQASASSTDSGDERKVDWTELVAGRSKLKLYGFLRLDVQYTDSRPNNTQTIGFIRSEDPDAPQSIGAPEDAETLTIHPRLTRFGVDYTGPRFGDGNGPKLSGKLEIDFYNSGLQGQAESREAIRMRKAYLQLDWDKVMLLAGQTSDLVSPLYPTVNPDLVMWGAGNLGDRRAQIRVDYHDAVGDKGHWMFQNAIGLTGAIDNLNLDPAGSFGAGFRDGETSGLPTFQSRLAYSRKNGHGKSFTLGLWGHRAEVDPDTLIVGQDDFESWAVGLDLEVPLYRDRVWLKSEWWRGANLTDVRGGIFQGINTDTGKEIHAQGGWVELGIKVNPWYTTVVGFSTDDPEDGDLNLGGRSLNEIFYWGNRFQVRSIGIGVDYLSWTTEYLGLDEGDANRLHTYVSYGF